MKKQCIGLLAVILTVSGFLFSCHDKKVYAKTGALEFDSITVNQTAHLFGDTATPSCNIVINFVYPVKSSDNALKDSLTYYFKYIVFDPRYTEKSPQDIVKQEVENYVAEYRHDLEPMYIKDKENAENTQESIGSWYDYTKSLESHVQRYEKDYLIYRVDYKESTGGAHGIYSSTFLNIDLTLMRPLQLKDIFVGDYQDPLTVLIWNQLMADNEVATHDDLQDLGYNSTGDIAPTENFYLSKDGITFYYNVYEITPYSMGAIKVTIPFSDMEHIMGSNPILSWLRDS